VVLRRVARFAEGEDHRGEPADLVRACVDEVTWYMSEHKVSRVSQILSGDENLTLRTLSAVVEALGAEFDVSLHPIDGRDDIGEDPA
jgi:hypothetical protein